jgi:hypothetical protein
MRLYHIALVLFLSAGEADAGRDNLVPSANSSEWGKIAVDAFEHGAESKPEITGLGPITLGNADAALAARAHSLAPSPTDIQAEPFLYYSGNAREWTQGLLDFYQELESRGGNAQTQTEWFIRELRERAASPTEDIPWPAGDYITPHERALRGGGVPIPVEMRIVIPTR